MIQASPWIDAGPRIQAAECLTHLYW